MSGFLDALRSGRCLLMDGAMGTELFRHGASFNTCLEEWNLTRPEIVLDVHRSYVEAGAVVLLTNTFQAFPARFERFALRARTADIIRAAVALARQASGTTGFVLGSLGPGTASDEELDEVLRAFGFALGREDSAHATSPVDALLLETMSDTGLLDRVLQRVSANDPPVLFSATYLIRDGRPVTFEGLTTIEIARRATDRGAAALGVNCGKDIDAPALRRIIEEYQQATTLPLFARPNAGTPREEHGRLVFPLDAAAFARLLDPFFRQLAMVGGCCGTNPDYIRRLSATKGA